MKIFGVFSVQISEQKPVYFIVMQSVFYPDQLLSLRYDIKGCLAGRYQSPGPAQGGAGDTHQVFKDQNFAREKLSLGTQRSWFVTQVRVCCVQVLRKHVRRRSGQKHKRKHILLKRMRMHVGLKSSKHGASPPPCQGK